MRVITLQDLHRHVLDLWGKADGIEWPEDNSWGAKALHEIGHIRLGPPEDEVVGERQAWQWARDNALIWTPTMENEAVRSLGSYEATLAGEEHVKEYYYKQIEACISDLLSGSNPDGLEICDALVRNAAELVDLYESCAPGCTEGEDARGELLRLVDKYLPAKKE